MAPPRLVSFASFLYTLKKYEDSHCPEYYSYLRQLQFLRKIPDYNKLFFPNHSNIYHFHLEDFELQDQISSRVEYFIHKPSKTPVVIKYIKIPFSEYLPSLLAYKLKQIEIEIRRVRSLKSPYLVQIYGWTIYGDYILVCMEKMTHSLKDVYNKVHFKNGQIPEEPLRKIAFFVIQALILLESQRPKILNRDIKPGNILLKYNGNNMFKLNEVKICDFGTLRELEKSGIGLRQEDMAYKPPEMFLYPKRVYDQREVVWSLGITMLESVRECVKSDFSISNKKLNDEYIYPTIQYKINAIRENIEMFIEQCFVHKYSMEMKNFVLDCSRPTRSTECRGRLKELLRNPMFEPYLPKVTTNRKWNWVFTLYFLLVLILSGFLWKMMYAEDMKEQNETIESYLNWQKYSPLFRQNIFVPTYLAEAKTFGGENNQENYIKDKEKVAKMQNDLLGPIMAILNLTMDNQEIQNLRLKKQEEQLSEMKRLLENHEYKLKHQLVPMGYGVTTQQQPEIKIMLDYVQDLKYRLRDLDYHIERVNWLQNKAHPYKNPFGPRSTTQSSDPEISPFARQLVRFISYIIRWSISVFMILALIIGGIVLVLLPIAICFIYFKYKTRPRIYRTKHINWTYLFEILPKTLAKTKTNRL